jgi:membrane protein
MPTGVDGSTSLIATLRRTVAEFREDGMTDWAAALTYYALLSLFPALIAVSSLIGLVADADTLTEVVLDVAPGSAADTLSGPIDSITSNTGAAGVALVLGLAGALWGASGYTAAFGRAGNVIYEVREGRPFWRLRPVQILVTLVNVVLLVAVVIALVMSGPLLEAVAEPMGLGDTALSVWSWAKWPMLLVAAMVLLVVLYALTPNVRQRNLLSVLPGALVALVLWGVATAGFAFYTGNFGSYDRTYGTLGGVVVLLVWIWLTNVALLLGAEFNAERERTREIEQGMPGALREIQLPVREEPEPPATH